MRPAEASVAAEAVGGGTRRGTVRFIAGRQTLRATSLGGFVLAWWLASLAAGDPRLLPSPMAVLTAGMRAVAEGSLALNFAATLARVLAAFTLSMLVGTALGLLAGRHPRIDALLDPLLTVALNLPVLVVIILAYVWIGLNEVSAIVAVAAGKIPTVAVTVREGARTLDPLLAEFAAVFSLPPGRRLRRIVLPQLMPYLAAASRAGLSITWKIVLIVELLGRPDGVGYALNLAFQNFDVATILAYGLLFAVVMLLLEGLVLQPWERTVTAWRRGE